MKNFPLLFCLVLFLASGVSAQTEKSTNCPKIELTVSDGYAEPGKIFTFTAKVENYDLAKLSFRWTTSSGEILESQTSSSIKVKVNEKGETPVAVIEIKGLPEVCPATAIETPPIPAQNNQTSNCPTIEVSGGGFPEKGQPQSFTANVVGAENRQLEYIWTVSSGTIVAGQGTTSITVETDKEELITANVEVKGFPEGCQNTATEAAPCGLRNPEPRLFDEYGSLANGDVEARTQNIFFVLGNKPGAQGYIINYGTKSEIARREKQIRYAISSMNLDATRITLVNGGANPRGKGVWTRVWLVPAGAVNPTPDM